MDGRPSGIREHWDDDTYHLLIQGLRQGYEEMGYVHTERAL